MESALIITSNEQTVSSFSQLLKAERCHKIEFAGSGSESRRLAAERDYDLIIINSPLKDEFGDELALDFLKNTASGVMIIVKAEFEAQIESKVSAYGAFVMARPLSRLLFSKSLRLLEATRARLNGIRKENNKLQKKIDDIRLINRAKCILMEYLSMTEPQAHKYLERQAMDLRLTKIEVAKRLLSTYES